MDIHHWQEQSRQRRSTPILMETARYKLQGLYSLLAGLVLLVGVPFYQAIILGPAGYRAPSDSAFNHADYAPLLGWVSNHGSAFTVFRILELLTFLLALRLPFALHRAFRSYGQTLARWMLVGGLGGLVIFAAMLAWYGQLYQRRRQLQRAGANFGGSQKPLWSAASADSMAWKN